MKTVAALLVLLLLLLTAGPALAFDVNQTFSKGTNVMSLEGGGGTQNNLEQHKRQTELNLWYLGLRYSLLPLDPVGPSVLRGALEIGFEPLFQKYTGARNAFWMGLSAQGRWHFISLGRFVPYVEVGAGAGGTDLKAIEIDSTFAVLLSAGLGASFFVTDQIAVYGGYRMIHASNGHTSKLNRGFEADTGVVGVSYYFK